uniref:TLC domain-containing protein n=1 Tax=viral metagenome TaxID=1070528 RepID=A0A6C0B173_9ZZZZ
MADMVTVTFNKQMNAITSNIANIIVTIQNIALFSISISSLVCCVNYCIQGGQIVDANNNITSAAALFTNLLPVIGVHAIVDTFLTTSAELKMHHVCTMGILFYNYYYQVDEKDRFLILYSLLKTEISSIFYVLKYWLPKNTSLYVVNDIIFYISFFKFRIVDVYVEVIKSNYIFDVIFNKYSSSNFLLSSILFLSYYGLYVLNLYWFFIINKILYKHLTKISNINTDTLCHYICSYMHFLNIPLSIYIYSYNQKEYYIFDMIGITGLSITSYLYHYDIYNRLESREIEEYSVPDKDNMKLFFNDSLFIHIRSFLTVVTSYAATNDLLFACIISGMFHSIFIYHSIINIFDLYKYDNYNYNEKNKKQSQFLKLHNVIMILPISVDVLFVYFNSSNDIGISFLLTNILIGLLMIVEPFYKLTHVAFHGLLIVQNYYLSLSHSS